ncbi:MAG: sugar nucleotide-binding protein [Solirubrobacterales bacterium]
MERHERLPGRVREADLRLLVTGAEGLLGSNLAAAAAQQSWSVLGTWRGTPVSLLGAGTAPLEVADRHACIALAEEFEPDVVVHAGAESSPGRLEHEPRLAVLNRLGAEHTLAAARTVRARYVLVSCDLVFSGQRPSGECWAEEDPTEPVNALGRSLLERERLTREYLGSWLITRPADVYGVNLSIPGATPSEPGPIVGGNGASAAALEAALTRARHVWERSGPPLRLLARLRAGQPLAAPPEIRRSPTYAWDYAQRVCELVGEECEGVYNTAGPAILGRLSQLRLLARVFGCDLRLVREGSLAEYLSACDEPPDVELPLNTALCDDRASFALGRPAVDPFTGHRLMRRQLERLLGGLGPWWEGVPPLPPRRAIPAEPAAPVPVPRPLRSALG